MKCTDTTIEPPIFTGTSVSEYMRFYPSHTAYKFKDLRYSKNRGNRIFTKYKKLIFSTMYNYSIVFYNYAE